MTGWRLALTGVVWVLAGGGERSGLDRADRLDAASLTEVDREGRTDRLQEETAAVNREGEGPAERISLRVEDCVALALANNLALLSREYGTSIEGTRVQETLGEFDPVFTGQYQLGRSQTPTNNRFTTAESIAQKEVNLNFGVRQKLFTGALASFDFSGTRTETNEASLAFLNQSVFSVASFTMTQPLLRGGWLGATMASHRLARLGKHVVDLQYHQQVGDVLLQTIQAYWDLLFSIENVSVQEESLALAENLLRINQKRVAEGVAAPVEILDAESQVASRRETLIAARNAVLDAEDQLKVLIYDDAQLTERWRLGIDPVSRPEEILIPDSVDIEASVETALRERRDLRALEEDIKARNVELTRARNAVLPALDLSVRTGASGQDTRALRTSVDHIVRYDDSFWEIGVSLEIPIGNRTAASQLMRARLELQQSEVERRQLAQRIIAEVRSAVRQIDSLKERIAASEKATELARERLDAEQKKFDAGLSTNFEVLELQENLVVEQVRRIRAILDLRIALALLRNAEGVLPESLGFSTEDPSPTGT